MKTLETTGMVDREGRLSLSIASNVPPGEHRVIILIDDKVAGPAVETEELPVLDVGPWLSESTLRREEMYGDDGR